MKQKNKILFGLLIGFISMATIRISNAGINNLKQYEALKLKPYKDSAGKWTIGWGHLIKSDEKYLLDEKGITETKATQLLESDLRVSESVINSLVTVSLKGNQYDALVSFVFNIGINAFRKSTMLRKINNGDYEGAANEFQRWKYAGGKESSGLIARREKERKIFIA